MAANGPDASGRHSHSRATGRGSLPAPAWRLPAGRIAQVIAALVSAALLFGFGYGWWSYRDLNGNIKRLNVFNSTTQTRNDIDGAAQNLLIVGNDDRSNMTDAEVRQFKVGRDGGSLNTDTMMIVHVPADGKQATLISLPRDAYVAIPGYGMNKLNSAYSDGYTHSSGTADQKRAAGMSLLYETVQNLTGLRIDHFVQVSLLGFVRISDAVGGVPVNLCQAVDDTRKHNIAHGIPGGSGLRLSAGKHTIRGVTALEFVRQREQLRGGDIDRERRQRYFLAAAFREVASAGTLFNPSRLHRLISAIDRSVYVDATLNILQLAQQVSDLSADNISGDNIPFIRYDTVAGAGSVEIVDPGQVQQWVKNLLGQGQAALGTVKAADPATVTVRVLNAGTANGAAGANATRLDGYGFTASAGDHAPIAATTVQYAPGMRAQAKALLAYLPRNVVLEQTGVAALTLVLGRDGLQVRKHGAAQPHSSAPKKPKPIDAGCIN